MSGVPHGDVVADQVRVHLADPTAQPSARPLVALLGRAAGLAEHLAPHEALLDPADPSAPSPDVVVVVLDDGGQTAADRRAVLAEALGRLPPAGRLLLVAHVVSGRSGPNPTFGVLLDDVVVAGGAMVHLEEVTSVRWPGEPLTRGVVVVVSSLEGRTDP